MSGLPDAFSALLFPEGYRCLVCDAEAELGEDGVCAVCRKGLRRCEFPAFSAPLDGLAASFWYDPVVLEAMHRFKYQGATYLARFFTRYIELPLSSEEDPARCRGQAAGRLIMPWHVDCAVPVPMHPLKAYIRGYNPPYYLALALRERYPLLRILPGLLRKTSSFTLRLTLSDHDERAGATAQCCRRISRRQAGRGPVHPAHRRRDHHGQYAHGLRAGAQSAGRGARICGLRLLRRRSRERTVIIRIYTFDRWPGRRGYAAPPCSCPAQDVPVVQAGD